MEFTYTDKQTDTKIKVIRRNIVNDDNDVTLIWLSPSLHLKLNCNKDILEKVGEQYFYSLNPYKNVVKNSDCFTTMSGKLNSDTLLNCILPEIPSKYNDCFFFAAACLKEYKKENILRYVSLNLPEGKHHKIIINNIKSYFLTLGLREIRIFVDNENDFTLLQNLLSSKFDLLKNRLSFLSYYVSFKWLNLKFQISKK